MEVEQQDKLELEQSPMQMNTFLTITSNQNGDAVVPKHMVLTVCKWFALFTATNGSGPVNLTQQQFTLELLTTIL